MRAVEELIVKLKVWGLFAMLLIIPISYSSGDIRMFQERLFVMSIMAYSSLFFGCVWMTGFFLLNLAMFIYNGMGVGSGQVMNIFAGCLLFTASRTVFYGKSLDIITNVMKVLILINVVWMTFQVASVDPLFIGRASYGSILWGESFNLPMGMFHLQAATGMFLALCIPFLIAFGWLIPILLLIPIILTTTSAAMLAAGVMFLYGAFYIRMVTFRRKIFYWLIIAVVTIGGIVCVVLDYKHDSLTGGSRFENWHLYFRRALEKPIFGYGPDSFRNLTPHKKFNFYSDEDYNPMMVDFTDEKNPKASYHSADEGKRVERFGNRVPKHVSVWQEAHNEYIQIFFEYGLAGIILIGAFLYEIFRRFRLSIDQKEVRILFGAILCYLIFSITQFPFHLARVSLFIPIILGAFFAYTDKDWDTFVKGRAYGV